MSNMETLIVFFVIVMTTLCCIGFASWYGKQTINDAEDKAKSILLAAKHQTNAYASMGPVELNAELARIFTLVTDVEIKSYISTRDSNAEDELYLRAQTSFLDYLAGSIDAIDARYGKDFLIKWFDLHFKTLSSEGVIRRMIDQQVG